MVVIWYVHTLYVMTYCFVGAPLFGSIRGKCVRVCARACACVIVVLTYIYYTFKLFPAPSNQEILIYSIVILH